MQTKLNSGAYVLVPLFIFLHFFLWIGMSQMKAAVINPLIPFLVFWDFFWCIFFLHHLFTDYWQYECTDENLIITNIVTKSKRIVPLKSISNVELTRHKIKIGYHHKINLTLANEILILEGDIENMEDFYNYLKQKI